MGWLGMLIVMTMNVMLFASCFMWLIGIAGLIMPSSSKEPKNSNKLFALLIIVGVAASAVILYLLPIFVNFWDWSGGFSLSISSEGIQFELK